MFNLSLWIRRGVSSHTLASIAKFGSTDSLLSKFVSLMSFLDEISNFDCEFSRWPCEVRFDGGLAWEFA